MFPGDIQNTLHGTKSTLFLVRGMRSTSSPSSGLGAYADIDGRIVFVSECNNEVVKVCATSVDAYPKQLPPPLSWQASGETTILSASELVNMHTALREYMSA
eukprot:255330-Amphidinium_carterae.1